MQPDLESISAGGSSCPAGRTDETAHRHRLCDCLRAGITFNQPRSRVNAVAQLTSKRKKKPTTIKMMKWSLLSQHQCSVLVEMFKSCMVKILNIVLDRKVLSLMFQASQDAQQVQLRPGGIWGNPRPSYIGCHLTKDQGHLLPYHLQSPPRPQSRVPLPQVVTLMNSSTFLNSACSLQLRERRGIVCWIMILKHHSWIRNIKIRDIYFCTYVADSGQRSASD